ncbi:hypothetical protein GGC65_000438 [Sphingopyxis sp. OAS728]|uniref:hypothetical protein n=1 Tax=Sphingopyxis sp. OAS728 TaxID=2663823 RepID=UPI001789B4FA|nr:hypothetical protein [Sphingopyxis sp. OAS728]MBE1525982.1 hypothetical protein [Sphingopyxis sp. OAS728]
MPSTKTMNKSFKIFLGISLATFLVFLGLHFFKDDDVVAVASCGERFHFDEFEDSSLIDKGTKNISDKFLSEILDLNKIRKSQEYCATSIVNRNNCVQYFQPKAAAGGDARVCVNSKAKTLVSVEFGE